MGVRRFSFFIAMFLALVAGQVRAESGFALPFLPPPVPPSPVSIPAPEKKPLDTKTLRRIGSTPMEVLHVTPSGRLLVRSPTNSALYLSRPDRPGLEAVRDSRGMQVTGENYLFTPTGKQLFVKDSPFANETMSHLIDLESQDLAAVGVVESHGYLGLPVFSPDDSLYAFFERSSSTSRQGWIFPVAEYRHDINRNAAQQTGFYLSKLIADELKDEVAGGTFSPEGARLGLLTGTGYGYGAYSRFGVYPIYDEEDGEYVPPSAPKQGTKFVVFDLDTGATDAVPLDQGASRALWINSGRQGEEVYLMPAARGHITRLNLVNKSQERVWKEEVERVQVSSDGTWAFFKPVRDKDEGILLLVNLRNQDAFAFRGAKGGVFTPDSSALVVSRAKVQSGQPFYRVDLAAYRDRAAAVDTDVETASFEPVGEGLAVWEIPHEKTAFESAVELGKPSTTKLADMGWDLDIEVKNTGPLFLGFDTKKPFGLVCELFDADGNSVVKWEPEFNEPEKQLPPRLGPHESVKLDCGVAIDKPLPRLFTGKIQYYIREYEEATRGEVEVK